MITEETGLGGVVVIEPEVFSDERGFIVEAFNERRYHAALGLERRWVQDNRSRSVRGVLRGIHYQVERPQGKLVSCVAGAIFDVAVDLRRSSATFGAWVGRELSASNHRQLWVPEGFGHGFLVLSDVADVEYKMTDYFDRSLGRAVRWNDPAIGIEWPLDGDPILSPIDANAPPLADAETFA